MEVISRSKLLLYCSIFAAVSVSSASSLFRDLMSDFDVCEDVCQKTYPAHTYDKSLSEDCCKRGCRLYSIIELVGDENDVNGTLKACYDNCNDAYPGQKDESAACIAGCNSQKPFTNKLSSVPGLESPFTDSSLPRMMYPFLYMHNMYSNMVDKVTHQMSVSWSFFMQDGTGRLVVIKSQPQVVDMDFDDYSSYRGTSSVAETNIEPAEHTATEMLRHSQLKSSRAFGDEVNAAE
ncbi:transmembrane protein 59-like, partial [Plakobranchus ocellatus]